MGAQYLRFIGGALEVALWQNNDISLEYPILKIKLLTMCVNHMDNVDSNG